MKHKKHGMVAMMIIGLGIGGFSKPAIPQAEKAPWKEVAQTRAVLKVKTSENLVRQFSYEDLRAIHRIGGTAMEAVLLVHDLLKEAKWSVEEIVKEALREARLKSEERFKMKIILERAVAGIDPGNRRSNDPNSPYRPYANDPNSPY